MRLAVVAGLAAAALVSAAAAWAALPYSTVARGTYAGEAPAHAYVALTPKDARSLSARLRPADRARVVAVDYRRYAVVAAVATVRNPCHALRVVRIERARRALVVRAAAEELHWGACTQVIAAAYHAVKLRKSALGDDPPRRAALQIAGRDR